MKRFPILGTLLLIPALALVFNVGCDKGTKTPGGDKPPVTPPAPTGDLKEITTATDGAVKGTVKYKGTAPTAKSDEAMAKHGEAKQCLAGKAADPNNVVEQLWLVNKDGGVANVVISLEPGAGKKYKIDDKLRDSFKKKAVIIDQPYCAYTPHVIALFAPSQPLIVKNSGGLTHNTMITPPSKKKNEAINKGVGPKSAWDPLTFEPEPGPFKIGCSAHQFMSGSLLTFEHPYFAVTAADGSFSIANVPVDEELTIFMWHESMDSKKEVGKLTAKAKEPVSKDLTIEK